MEPIRRLNQLRLLSLCFLLLPSFGAWSCVPPWLASQTFDVTGKASSPAGEALYQERLIHTAGADGGQLSVSYTDPAGDAIATKAVIYDCRPTTPSFTLSGPGGEVLESANWTEERVVTGSGEETSSLKVPSEPAIVDAGFDNAIKLYWDQLTGGEKPVFQYLFPRQGKFLKLRFTQVTAAPKAFPLKDENLIHFRITPANAIIRLFASPLYVGYRPESKTLRYYLGPSNLPSMRRQKEVLILYEDTADLAS